MPEVAPNSSLAASVYPASLRSGLTIQNCETSEPLRILTTRSLDTAPPQAFQLIRTILSGNIARDYAPIGNILSPDTCAIQRQQHAGSAVVSKAAFNPTESLLRSIETANLLTIFFAQSSFR